MPGALNLRTAAPVWIWVASIGLAALSASTPTMARPLDDVIASKVLRVVVYTDNAPFSYERTVTRVASTSISDARSRRSSASRPKSFFACKAKRSMTIFAPTFGRVRSRRRRRRPHDARAERPRVGTSQQGSGHRKYVFRRTRCARHSSRSDRALPVVRCVQDAKSGRAARKPFPTTS